MRTAFGYSGAVTRTAALAAGDIATTGISPDPGAHFFTTDPSHDGAGATTPDDAKWHNSILEELVYVLTTLGGLAPDDDDNTQLAQVLTIAGAACASETSTPSTPNLLDRVKIASGTGATATGAGSMVTTSAGMDGVPSGAVVASGAYSDVSGSHANTGSTVAASGVHSQARGCRAEGGDDITASGRHASIDGCATDYDAYSEAGPVVASGRASRVAASCRTTASGKQASAVSCRGVVVSGEDAVARAAAANPGKTLTVSGSKAVALGVMFAEDEEIEGNECVMLASGGDACASPTSGGVPLNYQVYGGVDVRTWRINSVNGEHHGSAFTASGADYAEHLRNLTGAPIAPGTILTRRRDGVRPAEAGDRVFGVVSTSPAILGNHVDDESRENKAVWTPVALLGQVPVRVSSHVTQEAIDREEAKGGALFVEPGKDGVGTKSHTWTEIEAMKMLEPGLCLCFVRP